MRRFCVCGNVIHIESLKIMPVGSVSSFWCWCAFLNVHCRTGVLAYQVRPKKNVILEKPNPRDQEREYHPCANLHLKKQLQIQWNCARLKFVSCTSNLWERMFDLHRYMEFLPRSMLSLLDPRQNRSLGTIPIDSDVLYFPRGNIACNHSCYDS